MIVVGTVLALLEGAGLFGLPRSNSVCVIAGFHRYRGRQVARAKSHHCWGRNCNLGISALFLLNRLTGTQVV